MKISITILFILVFGLSVFGQKDLPIQGAINDLASKKRVYLLAETTDSRKLMQKTLDKDKSFEIVSDPEKADFILEFKQISKSTPSRYGAGEFEDTAEMSAYFYNAEKRKVVAWSQTKNKYKKGWGLPKQNETYLTGEFLKVLNADKSKK